MGRLGALSQNATAYSWPTQNATLVRACSEAGSSAGEAGCNGGKTLSISYARERYTLTGSASVICTTRCRTSSSLWKLVRQMEEQWRSPTGARFEGSRRSHLIAMKHNCHRTSDAEWERGEQRANGDTRSMGSSPVNGRGLKGNSSRRSDYRATEKPPHRVHLRQSDPATSTGFCACVGLCALFRPTVRQ